MTRPMKDSGIEWVGDIPEKWNVIFAFQCFEQVKNKNIGMEENNLLSLSYGKIKRKSIDTAEGLLPDNFENYNVIDKDDIVLRLTDLQNDHKSLRVGLAKEKGIITSAYTTLRNKSDSIPNYLYYYLHAFDISKGFYGMGAGVRQGLNWEELKHLLILSPKAQEQRRIVEFLNNQSELIESLIEKTQISIEEYKKLKQAIIIQAVTKGVRGNRTMKESGIEWVGNIPESWEIHKLCWDYSAMLGKMLDAKRITGTKMHPYIKNADVQWWNINTENLDEMDFEDSEYERYIVNPGDLMICEGGEIGKCAIVPDDFPQDVYYQKALHRVRSRNSDGNVKYLSYVLFSMANTDSFNSTHEKATIAHLPGDALSQLRIPSPPTNEKTEIVNYLDQKRIEIDTLITKKEQFIAELENYKKSMIYEYVTGKKEA